MNPLDKFINPRPVPKPLLSRLKTSPPLAQTTWPSSNTPASSRSGRSGTSASAISEPGSANTVRILRGTGKPSFELPSRSGSRSNSPGSALSNGLRSAFRSLRSPRPASPDTAPGTRNVSLDRYLERTERSLSEGYDLRHPRSLSTSRDPSPSSQNRSAADQDLVFRKLTASPDGSVESVIPQSFQQHRRQRSTSREPSSLRNSLTLEDTDLAPLRDVGYPNKQPLSTLKEVASAQNTPGLPIVGPRTADLEKRLPTLPNSPSSAYPPSAVEEDRSDRAGQADLAERRSLEIDNLQSHFSTTTIDTSSSVHSTNDDQSHCSSAWSSEYPDTARSSAYATSFIDDEPMSALFEAEVMTPRREQGPRDDGDTDFEETPPREYPQRDESIPTVLTSSAVSSTTVSSLATSPSDYTPSEDNWRYFSDKHGPERSYHQRYRLPSDAHGSELTLKQPGAESVVRDDRPPLVSGFGVARGQSSSNTQSDLPHSNNMQHLIDELSYLGNMIHQK
jgi:hypothetical protein